MTASIEKAWQLYEAISTWSDKISAIRVNTGIREEPISHWFHDCRDRIEPLLKDENTQFLAIPVVESYFRRLLPAITIPATELLSDVSPKLEQIKELQTVLENHPAKSMWKERTEDFKAIAKQIGYEFENDRYEDLAAIAPIIANALTVLRGRCYDTEIFQVRQGDKSNAQPMLLNDIAVFRTEAQAVQTLERLPVKSFIGFVGIQPTYADTNDDAADWRRNLHNRPLNERKCNIMDHSCLTEEQHDQTPDMHETKLYAVVRNGENMWLFIPPYEKGQYDSLYDGFVNFYGRRTTYAPVQVFFKQAPDKSEGALIVRHNNVWSLKNILDEDQKVWLPIFLNTVKAYFFADSEPKAELSCLREETRVLQPCLTENNTTNLTIQPRTTIAIQPANEFFTRETFVAPSISSFLSEDEDREKYRNALTMVRWLNISEQDMVDMPFKIDTLMTQQKAQERLDAQAVEAYYALIAKRLGEVFLPRAYEAQRWYHRYIDGHLEQILKDANDGLLDHVHITIDKNPIYNEDGSPKMVHNSRWELVHDCDKTGVDHSHDLTAWRYTPERGTGTLCEYRAWLPMGLVGKRPPAVVHIEARTPEDVAKICHCQVSDLPEPIQYMNIIPLFIPTWMDYNVRRGVDYDIRVNLSKAEFKKRFGTKYFRK